MKAKKHGLISVNRGIGFVIPGIYCLLILLPTIFSQSMLIRLFKPPIFLFVIIYLPIVLFLFIIFRAVKKKRFSSIHWGLFLIALSVVLVFFISGVGFYLSAKPETNIANYKDALQVLGYPQRKYLNHFPSDIPKNATDANLYWEKGFLQASWFIQLRLTLPSSAITTILKENQANETILPVNNNRFQYNELPFSRLYAGEPELLLEWPEDFEIIVLQYGKPGNYKEEGYGTQEYWDNTYNYGLAISEQRNEIIYWAEEYGQ